MAINRDGLRRSGRRLDALCFLHSPDVFQDGLDAPTRPESPGRVTKQKTREAFRHRGFRYSLGQPWKRIWWARRDLNPRPIDYESAVVSISEL